MKNIFKHFNIELIEKQMECQSTRVLVIFNRDKSPRWVCNAMAKEPLFLKFYTSLNLKARVFTLLIKLIFKLKLQRWIFKTIPVYFRETNDGRNIISIAKGNWAIFTGTVGPNNKLVVVKKTNSETVFYKVATTSKSKDLLKNERNILVKFSAMQPDSFRVPKCEMIQENILKLEDVSAFGKRSGTFSQIHQKALSELYKNSVQKVVTHDLLIFNITLHKLTLLTKADDRRIPNGLITKLCLLAEEIQNNEIIVGPSHGDFTPWNTYVKNNVLAVYDWELTDKMIPIGFDAFHFIMQQGILVERVSWKKTKEECTKRITPEIIYEWTNSSSESVEDYFKLYLLINTVSNLHLYSKQLSWHVQIYWLLNTWSEAISDCIQRSEKPRGLMILDLFDYLEDKEYTTIKFPNVTPNKLSEYTDIDLCIKKEDLKDILYYVNNHTLSKHIHIVKKSFMATVQVFLKDGSLLSLDLIWKIKRKSLVMLSAKDVIAKSWKNSFGVKHMDLIDKIRYIGLFYGLNNAKIPPKYHAYQQLIKSENTALDKIIYDNFLNDGIQKKRLVSNLKSESENRYLNRVFNSFHYLIDTLKQFFNSKGLVITFSGVDGVGKSTIIKKVKYEIEKKLRKQVVVIRHRPSLLPIISAWFKGKEKARQDVISRLPRQGTNRNVISSLLRFGYYYADYFFGQFYIYFKYVLRGKIVLYDRFYFDLINDGKRSNIQLPKALSKFGFKFLLKPDINAFLYADAEVILSRKRELSKETIKSLTKDYLVLFKKFDSKSSKRFITIKNIDSNNTLNIIMTELVAKMI